MDQLPRLGKRELNCLLLFTCNYVVLVQIFVMSLYTCYRAYVDCFKSTALNKASIPLS